MIIVFRRGKLKVVLNSTLYVCIYSSYCKLTFRTMKVKNSGTGQLRDFSFAQKQYETNNYLTQISHQKWLSEKRLIIREYLKNYSSVHISLFPLQFLHQNVLQKTISIFDNDYQFHLGCWILFAWHCYETCQLCKPFKSRSLSLLWSIRETLGI